MKRKLLLVLAILGTSLSLFADGPSVGGGGDVVILPDDSVVLADPWIDSGAPQPNNMPPLRALNPRILQSINAYSKAAGNLLLQLGNKNKSEIADLLTVLATRKNNLRFYGVQTAEELNNFCAPGGRKIYKLPNGALVQQVACTAGEETFVVEPLFLRLSLRDQALLLVHERLTTLRDQFGGKNYSAVARFTTGLGTYLSVYSEQALKKYRTLTSDEQARLTDFYIAIEEIERRNSDVGDDSFQWKAHIFGGGLVHLNSQVDPTALVNLNTFVPKNSIVGAGAKLINVKSDPKIALEVGDNSQLINSEFNVVKWLGNYNPIATGANAYFKMGDNTIVTNSRFNNIKDFYDLGKNVIADKIEITSEKFTAAEGTKLVNSTLVVETMDIGTQVEVKNAKIVLLAIDGRKLVVIDEARKIADGEKLINANVDASTYQSYFPINATIKPINLNVNVDNFICKQDSKLDRKETSLDLKFLNANNDGVTLKGKIIYAGKPSVFKGEWNYSYENIVVNVSVKNFDKATDTTKLMIDTSGRFVLPGISRKPLEVKISSGLSDCAVSNIGAAIAKNQGNLDFGYGVVVIYPKQL